MTTYVEELIKVGYWTCNVAKHRHQSATASTACMLKIKGAKGERRRISRNLVIISKLKEGVASAEIALAVKCSSSNLLKAANSSLCKAYEYSETNGGCPFPRKSWATFDFCCETKAKELAFLVGVLEQYLLTLQVSI